jgi:hypothetical protein
MTFHFFGCSCQFQFQFPWRQPPTRFLLPTCLYHHYLSRANQNVSHHNLHTPASFIMSYADVAAKNADQSPEEVRSPIHQ